jgi:hypothetical protein
MIIRSTRRIEYSLNHYVLHFLGKLFQIVKKLCLVSRMYTALYHAGHVEWISQKSLDTVSIAMSLIGARLYPPIVNASGKVDFFNK